MLEDVKREIQGHIDSETAEINQMERMIEEKQAEANQGIKVGEHQFMINALRQEIQCKQAKIQEWQRILNED